MQHWRPDYAAPGRGPRLGRQRGYGGSWTRLARLKLQLDPICERCRQAPATEVHHRIPVAVAPDLKLAPSNLKAVCRACHEIEEKSWGR